MKFINPAYVNDGEGAAAAEFDRILGETLPEWAAEMSGGYAWNAPLPDEGDYWDEAENLAEHLLAECSRG